MEPQQIQLDPIKYLSNLPLFNGSKNDLHTFTRLIDRIHPLLVTYDELSQLVFSDIIKSRLVGKAKEIIEINAQARSWQEVKTILENNFGERKSTEELFDDLRSITFNSTTLEFYNEIKYRLRRLNNKAAMVMGEGEGLNQVALNNQRSALHIFRNKIPEPMRTILACRNPNTLESAMDILFENGYDKVGKDGLQSKAHKFNKDRRQNNGQRSGQNFNNGRNNNSRDFRKYNNGHREYSNNQRNWDNSRRTDNQQDYNSVTINQPQRNYPEPMEVNTVENFRHTASGGDYLI